MASQTHTYIHTYKMSKPTLSSLQTQVTTLTTQFAALSARLDTLTTPAPAPAPAPKKKRAKKERDPDAPKRAPGAYILFCQYTRAATPDVKILATELGERWNKLSAEQKAAFKTAKPTSKPTFEEAQEIAKKMNSSLAGKYLRYCVKNPTLDAKTAEARFRALSPEDKAKYNPYDSETDGSQLGSDNEYDSSDAE